MKMEFFAEGKYFKPILNKLEKSEFSSWIEFVTYMKENNIEFIEHENIALHCYHDEDLFQVCIVEKCEEISFSEALLNGYAWHSECGCFQRLVKGHDIIAIDKNDYWSTEICPHCNKETGTLGILSKCEHCGTWIAVCSMCDSDVDCTNCSICKESLKRNLEE